MFSRSLCALMIQVSSDEEVLLVVRSSAYEKGEGILCVMSVMKKMNRSADRTLPCGTPIRIAIQSDTCWLAILFAILSVRNDAILSSRRPRSPAWCSLYIRPSRHTLSNAPSRSMKADKVYSPLLLACWTLRV